MDWYWDDNNDEVVDVPINSAGYQNWVSGQPNDLPSGANRLVLRKSDGQWLDEVNSPSVPTGIILEW